MQDNEENNKREIRDNTRRDRPRDESHEDDLPDYILREEDDNMDPWDERSDSHDSDRDTDVWGEPLQKPMTEQDPDSDSDPDFGEDDWDISDSSEDAEEADFAYQEAHAPVSRVDHADDPPGAETSSAGLPLGLVVVAVVALILLAAGGYGVIQQRSAMQAEITELQARLAETASPDEIVAARRALEDIGGENEEMRALVTSLREENQRLSDTLAGLEQQVDAQREATDKARETEASTQAEPEAPKPAAVAKGDWFVNFGAYREQSLANEWAGRLRGGDNTVVVMPIESNGRTLYRVRITQLASESAARQLAGQLEKRFELDPLWVGRQ